jgi:outer membrane protein assembly factor BamB
MGQMRAAPVAMAALAVGVASLAVGAPSNASVARGDEWPMFMGGFTHAGTSRAVGPSSPADMWSRTRGRSYISDFGIPPVVGSDGTIYLLQDLMPHTHKMRLQAISPITHRVLWSWTGTGSALTSAPAVAPDGTVYVANDLGIGKEALYAIKSGGRTLWERPEPGGAYDGSPTIGPDGTVYVEDSASKLFALNPQNGHTYWTFTGSTSSTVETEDTPAISPDGTTLYLATAGGGLYALSAGPAGGQLEWTYDIQGPQGGYIASGPAVGSDGTIYVTTGAEYGATPGDIEAVNPNGTRKWAYVSNGGFETTPTVTATGQVVAGDLVGTVVALEQSDGTLVWSYSAPGSPATNFFDSSAASDANGNVYIQNQFSVFAFGPEGSLLWTDNESGPGTSPALDASGTLYVLSSDESLIGYESNG